MNSMARSRVSYNQTSGGRPKSPAVSADDPTATNAVPISAARAINTSVTWKSLDDSDEEWRSCSYFEELSMEFRQYHRNSVNVALHLITTPLGIVLGLALLAHSLAESVYCEQIIFAIAVLYSLFCIVFFPIRLSIVTFFVSVSLAYASIHICHINAFLLLLSLTTCVVCQDIAHWLTSERTYLSSYWDSSDIAQARLQVITQYEEL